MRRAPSEQCDYVFEGSAADCYIEIHRIDKVKNQIYRGVAQLVARLLWERVGCLMPRKIKSLKAPVFMRVSGICKNQKIGQKSF